MTTRLVARLGMWAVVGWAFALLLAAIGTQVAQAAAGPFSLAVPANGGVVASTPTLKWGTSSGATSYTLTITPSSGAALVKAGLTTTSYTVTSGEALSESGSPYTWHVTAHDSGSATADSNSWSFFVDTTPVPGFGLLMPAAGIIVRSRDAIFTWTAPTDAGISKYHFYVDGALCGDVTSPGFSFFTGTCNPPEGAHTWSVSAEDAAGNVRWCNEAPGGQGGRAFILDDTGPSAGNASTTLQLSSNTSPNSTSDRMVNTGVNVAPGDSITVTSTGMWCTLGCTVGCYGTDGYSNPTGGGVPAPNCPPASLIARVGGRFVCVGRQITFTAGSTDAGVLALGINSLNVGCNDKTVTAIVTGGRSFNLIAPAPDAVLNQQFPAFSWQSATDQVAGGVRYWLYIDGTPVSSGSTPTYLSTTSYTATNRLSDGAHTWRVRAFDAAGNGTDSTTSSFKVDTTRPNPFRLTSPANGSCSMSPTPRLCWDVATADATSYIGTSQIWIDGSVAFSSNTSVYCATPSAAVAPGLHTWYVVVTDVVGNARRSTDSFQLSIDYTPPAASLLTAPANGSSSADPPLFAWSAAADAGGVAKYELYVDGTLATTVDGKTTSWLAPADLAAGPHSWYVRALDACNQATSSATWTFTTVACTPDGATHACPGYNLGRCKPGVRTCTGAGVWSSCTGAVKPSLELCNQEDDDCNGVVDEGTNACGGVCTLPFYVYTPCDGTDADLCQEGVYLCTGLNALACIETTPDNAEICNGRDDDCNGTVDDACMAPSPDGGVPSDGGSGTGGTGTGGAGTGGTGTGGAGATTDGGSKTDAASGTGGFIAGGGNGGFSGATGGSTGASGGNAGASGQGGTFVNGSGGANAGGSHVDAGASDVPRSDGGGKVGAEGEKSSGGCSCAMTPEDLGDASLFSWGSLVILVVAAGSRRRRVRG